MYWIFLWWNDCFLHFIDLLTKLGYLLKNKFLKWGLELIVMKCPFLWWNDILWIYWPNEVTFGKQVFFKWGLVVDVTKWLLLWRNDCIFVISLNIFLIYWPNRVTFGKQVFKIRPLRGCVEMTVFVMKWRHIYNW